MKKILIFILTLAMLLTTSQGIAFAEEATIAESAEAIVLYTGNTNINLAKKQFKSIYLDAPEGYNIIWQSVDESIAKVVNGKITGVSTGTTNIVAGIEGTENNVVFKVTIGERKTGTNLSSKKLKIVQTDNAKYTYKHVKADLKKIHNAYPEIMSYHSIAKTADNRNIYEAIVGNPNAKKHIIVQATMHAREYINSLIAMRQIESICANYYTATYKGKYYSEIFDKVCIHFIPMTNPDGVAISAYGPNGIKDKKLRKNIIKMKNKYGKNRSDYYKMWKANARGVDLNRNYNINWKKSRSPKQPCQANYIGDKPYSEIETKTLIALVKDVKPITVLSYHSTGSMIYWNFNRTGKLQEDCKTLFNIASGLTHYIDAEPNVNKNSKGVPCFGDWVAHKQKTPTLTIETGNSITPIPQKEIKPIWDEMKHIVPAIAYWALKQ